MDGINTKRLVVNPEEAANIRLMFEMYAQPTTSYGDITRHFAEQGILFNGRGNDAADFTGINGCYLYQGRDVKPGKAKT